MPFRAKSDALERACFPRDLGMGSPFKVATVPKGMDSAIAESDEREL